MRWHLADGRLAVVALLAVCVCQGCGTGEYEERLTGQLANLKKGSVFQQLYDAAPLGDTPVLIRIPKVFSQSFREGSKLNGRAVDPRRVKPPAVDLLGGLKIAYEAFITDSEGTEKSYYLYLAALKAAEADKSQLTAPHRTSTFKATGVAKMNSSGKLCNALEKAFPGKVGQWQDVQCPALDGHELAWQKLRVTGNQGFHCVDRDKQERYTTLPGVLEFYVRQEGDFLVLIIWRVPGSIESQAKLAELAPLVAGSVSLKKK